MSAIQQLLTEHLDIWTAADTGPKSGRGRSSANAGKVYGVSKLRELILELAVRGKLVPQDAGDEPASELLKRIQVEKAKLIADGKIKKDKTLPPITDAEQPLKLPQGWAWAWLGEVTSGMDSGWSPACLDNNSPSDNVWGVLKTTSVQVMDYLENENKELPSHLKPRPDAEVKAGDILFTRAGPMNRVGISCLVHSTRPRLMISDKIIRFHPIDMGIYGRFIALCLNAGATSAYLEKSKSGMAASQVNITQDKLRSAPVPISPLAEQHRIVAKVDELMALCDQLEAAHNNATVAHEKLKSHLLGTLTQSQSAEDFSANWQRIATHFDTLFTTEASIDTLKQTLLQLAVMGKLVPQDPNDEPASELLKRIQAEKAKLIAEGKIKKDNLLPPITNEENLFDLPAGWEWVRLANISASVHYGYTASSDERITDVRLLRITDIQDDAVEWSTVPGCEIPEDKISQYELEEDDILIARTGGTIGKSYLVKDISVRSVFASYLIRVRHIRNTYAPYKKIYLGSQLYWSQLYAKSMGTGQPNVNGESLKCLVVPLPPLAEQHRIVAKVDELTALFDHLKARLIETGQLQRRLADVLVDNVVTEKALAS